jgi:hypothetical protein
MRERPVRLPLRLTLTLAVLLVAGCASVSPPSGPYWEQQVRSAVPPSDGAAQLISVGSWLPDVQGFEAERSHRPLTDLHEGAFVVTPASGLFMEWVADENRYRVAWRLAVADLARVRVDAYGLNRRLVITAKDHHVATFQLSGTHGAISDPALTQRAAALLKKAHPS